jgi:hypothetical protein
VSIDDLVSVVSPPQGGWYGEIEWADVERQLGCALPVDYKDVIRLYGPGHFSQFIHIYQPSSDLPAIDLVAQAGDSLWALKYLRESGEPMPYRLDDPAEMLAFGRTDNGDILFWRRIDLGSPEKWTVLAKEPRGEEWFEFLGGMSEFLAGVLTRRVVVPFFPRRFPSMAPAFESY